MRHSLLTANDGSRPVPAFWPVAPEDRLPNAFWQRAFTALLQWLGLFAILLPFLAPFFDNHYALRDPFHTHIYVGGVVVDHYHPPASASREATQAARQSAPDAIDGAYSLPSAGAATAERTPLPVRTPVELHAALAALLFAGGMSVKLASDLLPTRDELFFPPPEKPPRLVLGSG